MYKAGQHWFICDVCGYKTRSTDKRRRWDGLIVCSNDYETDHPQKYIRVEPDGLPVSDPRPRPVDEFVVACDLWTSSPMADYGTADCATVGGNTNIELLLSNFSYHTLAGIAIPGSYYVVGVP